MNSHTYTHVGMFVSHIQEASEKHLELREASGKLREC